jgi:hypothetical protein
MFPATMSFVGAVILILDIFAIVSVLIGQSAALRKVFWIAIVLLFPVVGVLLYFLIGRSSADASL